MGQSRNMQCNTACPAKGHVRFTPKSDIKCDIGNVRQARSGHVGVGTNYQNSDQKNQDQVNLYGIAGLTNIFYKTYQRTRRGSTMVPRIVNNNKLKSQMTKLLILIPILKIVVAVVVGIACGALILRFIFEVGATQTSTNSRNAFFGMSALGQ